MGMHMWTVVSIASPFFHYPSHAVRGNPLKGHNLIQTQLFLKVTVETNSDVTSACDTQTADR